MAGGEENNSTPIIVYRARAPYSSLRGANMPVLVVVAVRDPCPFMAPQAYSPLAKGQKLDDPTIVDIAQALGKTPAQARLVGDGLGPGFGGLLMAAFASGSRAPGQASAAAVACEGGAWGREPARDASPPYVWQPTAMPALAIKVSWSPVDDWPCTPLCRC